MPLFNGTLFQIDQKEMMRYAGLSPKVKEFPQDAIDSAIREALALAEPKGIWQILPYDPEKGTIGGAHPLTLTGRSILRHLSHAWSVGVLAVTVGEEIEKASSEHFKSGEYLQGLLLDAAATAAVEHLADQVDTLIQREAARSGQHTVWRFSPGYGDWPITQQPDFCRDRYPCDRPRHAFPEKVRLCHHRHLSMQRPARSGEMPGVRTHELSISESII